MKVTIWLALLILLLTAIFIVPKLKNRQAPEEALVLQNTEATNPSSENSITLSVSPVTILQGEPVLITVQGITSPSMIQSLSFDAEPVPAFTNNEKTTGLVGVDFHKKPEIYPLILILTDGRTIKENIEVKQRKVSTTEFDIPDKLGGNTPQAEHTLTESLAEDTAIINSVVATTRSEKFWNEPFRLPLDGAITITDVYGYKRQTGSVDLSHQGTDFRASEGTSVYAMNSGRIAFAGTFRNYGHTVIIDHGLGIMTAYMHLSETKVVQDKMVEKGELIALSGNTGYSLGPHLHLSIRINGLTIDPMKFLELMGEK